MKTFNHERTHRAPCTGRERLPTNPDFNRGCTRMGEFPLRSRWGEGLRVRCAFLLAALTQLSTLNFQLSAAVTWIGGSGDWNTPVNWTTGALPRPDEDVVMGVPGSITVPNPSGTHSIKSLPSQEALVLSDDSLTISNTIQVNNTFTLSGLAPSAGMKPLQRAKRFVTILLNSVRNLMTTRAYNETTLGRCPARV